MPPVPQEHVANDSESSFGGERVVISGISGLYPNARNVKELSNILYNKVNPINDDHNRWNYNHPELCNKIGKIPGLGHFDAQFFKVHWRQGNNMDPMSRKLLEQSFQAIYDAGLSPNHLSGKKVGVYIGSCYSETEKACFYVATSRTGFGVSGCNKAMFANRISYWLNAKGPSMAIDQACCSSLAALEQAYQAIQKGDCEAAIVGGANLNLHPQSSIHISRIMKLSADGKTKSFDQNADGCAKSEAVNVLFLQKAKDALRIYADVVHVKSEFTGILDGELGPRYGFYRDPIKMATFLKNFYEQAGIPPQIVEYVEAYGSAVPEVDKVELETIDQIFCTNRNDSLPVGSVMSNIGYSEAASGISAITKVLLGYQSGELAGNLHLDTPRTDVKAITEGKIQILDGHRCFQRTYAAVNAMSVTGINAHVLLNGHYKRKDIDKYKASIPYLITASGRQEVAIAHIFNDLKSRPIDPEEIALFHKIHDTNTSGHMGRGFTILDTKNNETVSLCEKAGYYDDMRRPLWFVYSGMGSQWPGMGTKLMRIPIFAAAIERCRKVLEPKGIDIVNIITSTDKTIFDNILHSFVGIAAVQIGLTDILREIGIVPDNIIGHSVGELGCAYADGCFTAEEMILSAYSRGLVSLQTPFIRGSMAAVGLGYSQIKHMCPPEIEVACHNGPESCTISGPAEAMREFVAQLTAKGIFAKEVPCSNIAYHSRYIADAGPGLLKYLNEVIKTPRLRSERWVSTSVPRDKWHEEAAQYSSALYHTNNLLNPVLFEETSRIIPSNAVLVEIAPHGLLQAILKRSLPESCRHIPLTRRGHPDNAYLVLEAIGKMYLEGFTPKVYELYPKVEFPVSTGTPMLSHLVEWDHREIWPVPLYAAANRGLAAVYNHIISLHDDEHAYLRGHVIRNKTLYPFAGALVAAWDTLAMSMSVPKKQMSVQFQDVYFYSQPILHDQRRLKLTVQLLKGNGYFEVMDGDSKIVSGFIKKETLNTSKHEKDLSEVNKSDKIMISQDIYDLLHLKGYGYSGEFRSIYEVDASFSEAVLEWNNNWVTLIDGVLQLHALRRPHDHVSKLTRVGSLHIDVTCHSQAKVLDVNGRSMVITNISKDLNYTRCGGILIEKVVLIDILAKEDVEVQLEALSISHIKPNNYNECSSEIMLKPESPNVQILRSSCLGDIDSLKWVQNEELIGEGVDVEVHYAGINGADAQVAAGINPPMNESKVAYGMDFSGITKSGERVMGIVTGGALSSQVRAHPALLWPVPPHWSLKDAATVPLAYLQAVFCLTHSLTDKFGGFDDAKHPSVLIHGGAGAVGQAAIRISLALGYQVFTTVSSISKKNFLKKLFPELKDKYIGCSRDQSFCHMVLNETEGYGCNFVISCMKGYLKTVALRCCASCGVTFDLAQVTSREIYNLNMGLLSEERSYLTVDVSSILEDPNSDIMKYLHQTITEGIKCGFVRPLSHVVYAPSDAVRAFRLVAAANHRGRALIHMQASRPLSENRINCSKSGLQIVLCNRSNTTGMLFAERLLSRGARNVLLIYDQIPGYVYNKIRSWESQGAQVKVTALNMLSVDFVNNIFNGIENVNAVEGVYVLANDSNTSNGKVYDTFLNNLDVTSRKLCPNIKYFAVLCSSEDIGQQTYSARIKNNLPSTLVHVTKAKGTDTEMSQQSAVDALERALLHKSCAVTAKAIAPIQLPLLERLSSVIAMKIPLDVNENACLEDLVTQTTNIAAATAFLRDEYDVSLTEEQVLKLPISRLKEIERYSTVMEYEPVKGLAAFYTLVDSDEMIATTEMILLPTLANNIIVRDDEFDVRQKYLYIIPGMEGHHEKFRVGCERFKFPTLVLQPGLDRPKETVEELAQRYAKIIIEKTNVKDNFFLLGYENGVAVSLEIAAILENKGYTGTVFCLGFMPEEFKMFLEQELSEFKTEEQLQDAVIRHMYTLMTKESPKFEEHKWSNVSSWGEKVEACVRTLLGQVSHSAQYARALIEAAYARILRAREYNPKMRPLRSRVVYMRAATTPNHRVSSSNLKSYSKQPIPVHQLTAPLPHALSDLRCASIFNSYLDSAILEEFDKKNLCETYLLNSDTFMSSSVTVD